METKTILQWLEEIPHPEIRERAMRNFDSDYSDDPSPMRDWTDAVVEAFDWDASPEGGEFWERVSNDNIEDALALLTPSNLEVAIGLLKMCDQLLANSYPTWGEWPEKKQIDEFLKGK